MDADLRDFTNNIASDLGPLLSLFGDAMTKQYLSECTTLLDYIIFGIAPIGIITAIVSVIRLCGHPYLRAFIGRAQEGTSTAELELCTSTGRDVGELFNKGGITRVLGRPSVLELVYYPEGADRLTRIKEPDKTGLYISRHFFKHERNFPGRSSKHESLHHDGTNPNISLNVGIVKPPGIVFKFVGTLGICLQGAVVAFAVLASTQLDLPLDEEKGPSNQGSHSLILFIAGTVLMSIGMGLSAAIIGQTTREESLSRTAPGQEQLIWVQPGDQTVGDQIFDSFALLEGEKHQVKKYLISTLDEAKRQRFKLQTTLAVIMTLIGFIAQFIGLRGLNTLVAIVQLVVTILMSLVRGSLRMQRRGIDANELLELNTRIIGHELDWLAMRIHHSTQNSKGRFNSDTNRSWRLWRRGSKPMQDAEDPGLVRKGRSLRSMLFVTCKHPSLHDDRHRPEALCRLIDIRSRLAYLTGNVPSNHLYPPDYQVWKSDLVKVREKSIDLSRAICIAAEVLFSDLRIHQNLRIKIGISRNPSDHDGYAEITLESPPDTISSSWTVKHAQMEAIIGLWLWSLQETVFNIRHTPLARIVSFGKGQVYVKGELSLWLGSSTPKLLEAQTDFDPTEKHGIIILEKEEDKNNNVKLFNADERQPETNNPEIGFFGWERAAAFKFKESRDKREGDTVQYLHSGSSLLDVCAQELFATMLVSMSDQLGSETFNVLIETDRLGTYGVDRALHSNIRLESETIKVLIKAFQENELGSPVDAVLCIIPALRTRLRVPLDLKDAVGTTLDCLQDERVKESECLLQAAVLYATWHEPGYFSTMFKIAEFYRRGFARQSKEFARRGIDWLTSIDWKPFFNDNMQCYKDAAMKVMLGYNGLIIQDVACNQLVSTINTRDLATTLYYLCFLEDQMKRTGVFDPRICLALGDVLVISLSQGLPSIIAQTLISLKGDAPLNTNNGRSSLSYVVEKGDYETARIIKNANSYMSLQEAPEYLPIFCAARQADPSIGLRMVDLLLDGGSVNEKMNFVKTRLLSWAAASGHLDDVRLALDDPGVNADAKDADGKTPLMLAAKNNKKSVVDLLLGLIPEDPSQAVLGRSSIDPRMQDNISRTALSWAAEGGYCDIVQSLVKKAPEAMNQRDQDQQSPLSLAAEYGHEDVVEFFLDHPKLDPEAFHLNSERRTPLAVAAYSNQPGVVRIFVEGIDKYSGFEIDINSRDTASLTPLILAAQKGYLEVVECLLEPTSILINAIDLGRSTALWFAARDGFDNVVDKLLEHEVTQADLADVDDNTPLATAVEFGQTMVVEKLLRLTKVTPPRVAVESRDFDGRTPLAKAARYGRKEIIHMLRKCQANPNSVDNTGRTPLHHAAEYNQKDVIDILLDWGVGVDAKTLQGSTSLALAVKEGHKDIVETLLNSDARPDISDVDGWTPLCQAVKLAVSQTNEDGLEVIKMLLEKNADTACLLSTRTDEGRLLDLAVEKLPLSVARKLKPNVAP